MMNKPASQMLCHRLKLRVESRRGFWQRPRAREVLASLCVMLSGAVREDPKTPVNEPK